MNEYEVGAPTWNSLAHFRFTLVGLYLAAVGLLYASNSPYSAPVILCLAIPVWLIDLRTRLLLRRTQDRLKDIERETRPTGHKPSQENPTALFHALDHAPKCFRFFGVSIPHWGWRERIISYSTPIDLVILATIAVALIQLVSCWSSKGKQ